MNNNAHNGVPDTFIATATAALEWGALPFARGVIANHFRYYVRDDGMVWHRAEALPASARAPAGLKSGRPSATTASHRSLGAI